MELKLLICLITQTCINFIDITRRAWQLPNNNNKKFLYILYSCCDVILMHLLNIYRIEGRKSLFYLVSSKTKYLDEWKFKRYIIKYHTVWPFPHGQMLTVHQYTVNKKVTPKKGKFMHILMSPQWQVRYRYNMFSWHNLGHKPFTPVFHHNVRLT